MRAAVQFLRRQSAWLTLFSLLFAVLNGTYICEGLWQGVGLHGYIIEPGAKGGPPHVVSVWSALIWLLMFFGLAVLFGLITLHKNHAINVTATPRRRDKTPLRGVKKMSTRK